MLPIPRRPASTLLVLPAVLLGLAGCVSPASDEKSAVERTSRVSEVLRAPEVTLPVLTETSPVEDYMRYAVLKHPAVRAAFADWRAAVQSIPTARALPDPQLTFEADIADMVMTLMPGVMFDFMAPGKRGAMAREATATSEIAYRNYVATVLKTAAAVRSAWVDLAYVEEALRLRAGSIRAINTSAAVEASTYATSSGMASLEAQVLLVNQAAQIQSTIVALEDRRSAARLRFKASLALLPTDPDPAWPMAALTATVLPSENELWQRIANANADLASMRSMVEMALAAAQVAEKARLPDFAVGVMADLKADPLMVRPTASVTLPIWREKIRAAISSSRSRAEAAQLRLDAELLNMAAEFAQMLYMVRESDRMIDYINRTALPNLERSIASTEAAYQSGMGSPAMIPQTRLMALGMELERAEALRARENAVTALLLMAADVLPKTHELLTAGEPR